MSQAIPRLPFVFNLAICMEFVCPKSKKFHSSGNGHHIAMAEGNDQGASSNHHHQL